MRAWADGARSTASCCIRSAAKAVNNLDIIKKVLTLSVRMHERLLRLSMLLKLGENDENAQKDTLLVHLARQ